MSGDRPRLPDNWLPDRLRDLGYSEEAITELVAVADELSERLNRETQPYRTAVLGDQSPEPGNVTPTS